VSRAERRARDRARALRQIVVFLVVCAVTAFVSIATAQRPKGAGKGGAHPPPKKGQDAAAAPAVPPMTPDPERPQPASGAAGKGDPKADRYDGGVIETRTGDGGTKSYRFEEVSIEGRLQSPELVYFLRRVRAEFNAGELGHRSFMGELSDTKKDPNLR
jgi:hypothetical protein